MVRYWRSTHLGTCRQVGKCPVWRRGWDVWEAEGVGSCWGYQLYNQFINNSQMYKSHSHSDSAHTHTTCIHIYVYIIQFSWSCVSLETLIQTMEIQDGINMETCTCRQIKVINCRLHYLRVGSNNFTRNTIALLNRPELVGSDRQLRKKWGCRPTKSKRFARRSTMIIRILRMMISTSEMWMRTNNNGAGRPQTKGMLDVSIKHSDPKWGECCLAFPSMKKL
jgi:hypothetical protein